MAIREDELFDPRQRRPRVGQMPVGEVFAPTKRISTPGYQPSAPTMRSSAPWYQPGAPTPPTGFQGFSLDSTGRTTSNDTSWRGTAGSGPGPYVAPTTGANVQPQQFDPRAFEQYFRQQAKGRAGTVADFDDFYTLLQQQYPQIERFGSKGDKIRLPNGQVIDAIKSAGLGGLGYQYLVEGAGGGGGVGSQFSDPYTKQLEQMARAAISRLNTPLTSGRDRTSMIEQARARAQELRGPGFTNEQRALLSTQLAEPTEALRSASKQRALERASARGFAPSSGLTEIDMRDIDTAADRARTESQRQLSLEEINRQEAKKAEAFEVDRYLSDAETARQLLQEGRYGEALQIAEGLSRLPERRLQLAQGALGSLQGGVGGTDPLSALMQIFGQNQQANQFNRQMGQNYWMGLGQLATQLPWDEMF